MPLPASRAVSAARLCALNGGLQLVWGAILGVSLQARSIELSNGGDAVTAYAITAAAGALVATVMQIVVGIFSDRERARIGHRQRFYAAGVALTIPALFWFYFAPSYGQLVAAFLALELSMNVVGGPYQAVIPDFVERDRRGVASSWMAVYQSMGNAYGLLVAGLLHDLRFAAIALALPFAATYAATATHLRELPAAAESDAAPQVRPLRIGGPLEALLVSRGIINIGFFTLLGFLLFFVRDSLGAAAGDIRMQTAFLFLTFTLCAIPGAAAAAVPTDRHDKRLVVTAGVATIVVALALLATAHALPIAYVASALAGVGWGGFVTADWALAAAVLPPGEMATSMGIWNVATALPQVIAPLATAPLVSRLNAAHAGSGPRAAIALALVEFAIGGAAIWRLPRA
jgi:MFS family permease